MDTYVSELSRMRSDELKSCQPLREQKTTGRKEELNVRVFVADVVLTKTAEEVEREGASDYKPCMKMDENTAETKLGPES